MSFPERLKFLRKERRVGAKDVYQSAGLSQAAYYYYERGEREPNLTSLSALADYFNVSADYLLGRSNNPAPFRPA